jgi:hypothetical protein
MTTAESHPNGHLPIEKVTGISEGELALFDRTGITHAKWVEAEGGELEISRRDKGGETFPHWEVFRGRGGDSDDWVSIPQ